MKWLALALLLPAGVGDEWVERVDALLAPWDVTGAPGGAVAVVRDGELVYERCFGQADLAEQRPVTRDTPFYLASLAKSFTAGCVLHAAAAGALDLDASLLEVFPELPPTFGAATLRHCLHHRSGIADVYDAVIAADLGPDAVRSNDAALELLTRLPELAFEPGTRFLYCNSGYVLLAEALHRRTGKDLATYAREHVFDPHGMRGAAYLGDELREAPARAFGPSGGGWEPRAVATGLRGPGGLYASLSDLVAWSRAAPGAGALTPPAGPHHPVVGPYAAGWMLQTIGGRPVARHFGGAFGSSADLIRFTDADLVVVALSNNAELDAADLAPEVARLVSGSPGDVDGPEAVTLTAEERERFGRFWTAPETGGVWVVLPRADGFGLASLGDVKVDLVPVSATRLEAVAVHAPLAFERVEDGARLDQDGVVVGLEPLPFPPVDLAPLDDYVGDYASATLDAVVTLELRGGRLALRQERPLLTLPPFHHIARDLFLCDAGAVLRFERDAEGRVVALELDVNRARGLRFEARR